MHLCDCQLWIERQVQNQVPAGYFMVTFTLPAQLRPLAWLFQSLFYNMMFACIWETLQTFSQNDKQLQGNLGVIAVLHTHSREYSYHPHIHVIMPAAAISDDRIWRTKEGKRLFNHKALASVFRAKMIDRMNKEKQNQNQKLNIPSKMPKNWNVHCKKVGGGEKALIYLGRYLYRGVIQEKDILSCEEGKVTFRYKDSKTGHYVKKTLSGSDFLWTLLRHVLPKGFRRTRNYGFLHPNSKHSITLLQFLLKFSPEKLLKTLRERPQMTCPCCGGKMKVERTRVPRIRAIIPTPVPT